MASSFLGRSRRGDIINTDDRTFRVAGVVGVQRLTLDTLNGLALERMLMPSVPFEAVVLDGLAAAVVQVLSGR